MPSLRAYKAGIKARSRFGFKSRVKRSRSSTGMTFRRPRGRRAILQKYNTHSYKRWGGVVLYTGTASIQQQSAVFDLNKTVNSSELTALYDQYMITGVLCKISMVTNPDASYIPNTTATLNTNNTYPKIWWTRDYDNTATEDVDALKQRNTTKCRILRPNSFVNIYLKPAVLNQIYLDGVSPATSPIWNQWIDCNTSTVPHYGLKFAIDTAGYTSINSWQFRMETLYYIKFKNCR